MTQRAFRPAAHQEWVDKVSGLGAGGPVISATVAGVPVSVRIRPDGIAGECECPTQGLCAHAVAAVLAWVRAGTDADEPDLFEVLRMQDPDLAGHPAGGARRGRPRARRAAAG